MGKESETISSPEIRSCCNPKLAAKQHSRGIEAGQGGAKAVGRIRRGGARRARTYLENIHDGGFDNVGGEEKKRRRDGEDSEKKMRRMEMEGALKQNFESGG